jgi:hypothetical protein
MLSGFLVETEALRAFLFYSKIKRGENAPK